MVPEEALKQGKFFSRRCLSLKTNLLKEGASGIIAEFKQKSPSKGIINFDVKVEEVTLEYSQAGASGLSVLTDFEYFGGTIMNLVKAREANPGISILRKDFVIDSYQLVEAKAYGADVILLIAACLSREEVHGLAGKARELGLEVLLEIHDESELDKISSYVDLVGVNNRNLKTLKVNIETSLRLAPVIPGEFVKISESGLSTPETIIHLEKAGFMGFLISETFMKMADPGKACDDFISQLKAITR